MFIRSLLRPMVSAPDGAATASPFAAATEPAVSTTEQTTAAPPAFAETLPEAIRGEAAFKDIKDLGTLAANYLAAQKIAGDPNGFVKLPTGSDDAAAWETVYAKLGRPDAPDKYALKAPDGLTLDDTLKNGFQAVAHKAGVTQSQAQALFDWYNSSATAAQTQASEQTNARVQAGLAALKTEWGAAYDANVALAKQAVDHYGGAKLVAELDAGGAAGLGNSPELARVLAKIGQGLQEDGLIGRGSGGVGDALSPAEAKQQIASLQQDKAFMEAYMNGRHPGHKEAVVKMQRLYEFQAAPPAG